MNNLVCSRWQFISFRADAPADLPRLTRPPVELLLFKTFVLCLKFDSSQFKHICKLIYIASYIGLATRYAEGSISKLLAVKQG